MKISNSLHANLHKDRKDSFEVDEKRKKFLYSIDSASLLCIKKQVLILNQHLHIQKIFAKTIFNSSQ